MRYTISILGTIQLRTRDAPIDLGRGVHRDVLTLLALDRRGLTSEQLAGMLASHDHALPIHNVHSAVTRLRRIAPGAVVRDDSRYRLADEVEIDAERFRDAVRDASRLDCSPAEVVALLEPALGLWRGEVLDGWPRREHARLQIVELRELRFGSIEHLATALADVARDDEAIELLERLLRLEPLREQSWAVLAETYERRGDTTAALATLDRARRELAAAGLDVGLQLQDLRKRFVGAMSPRVGSGSPTEPDRAPTSWVADFLHGALQMAESQHWPPFGAYDRQLLARIADGSLHVPPAIRGQALALMHVENRLPARTLIRRAIAEERDRSVDGLAALLDHLAWFRLGHDAAEIADLLCDVGRADAHGAAYGRGLLRAWSAAIQCNSGHFADAERGAEVQQVVDVCADPALRWSAHVWDATRSMALGDLGAAAAAVDTAFALLDSTAPDALPRDAAIVTEGQRLSLAFLRGDLAVMEALLARMSAQSDVVTPLLPARAVVAAYSGRAEESRRALDQLLADRLLQQPRSSVSLVSLSVAVGAVFALDDAESAEAFLGAFEQYRHDHVVVGKSPYFGAAVHHMGLLCGVLGEWQQAVELLEEALDTHWQVGASTYAAMSSWQLARALHHRGDGADRSRVAALREAAHADATRIGLPILRAATEHGPA